jgi:sulfur carrier protein
MAPVDNAGFAFVAACHRHKKSHAAEAHRGCGFMLAKTRCHRHKKSHAALVAAEPAVELTVNGEPRRAAEGASVADLLVELNLAGRPVAVEVNRQLVPRTRHPDCRLADGDQVEIVTLVGGG